ncbi:tripartite tricarboxylate transporter permease [Radiobacillus kanasensis]|uniref:tripartite tricarboxylate transporter permease n=1 Tax=Radiobacillus kanasensis TaxID=2844358 RepID=UPI001E41C857|nr:tripartite tricarboxylate transporter permease [Radiobacillus kanasensis]UFT98782.1 tripartite tricarboxylate transporter permease [Radiobacillus kanasensis]
MDISSFFESITGIFLSSTILFVAFGTILGVIFGAIPGLTATLAVVILLPFTYGMDPVAGLSTLVSAYIGGISGGVVAAILIGMPGTPSSVTTVFDGYPLAKKGLGAKALSMGAMSNLIGSVISLVFLVLLAPQLAKVALSFTPFEYAMVMLFAFVIVAGLTGDFFKSILVTVFGLILATWGFDPINAVERNPLGIEFLRNGIPAIPALIGLFVISRVFEELESDQSKPIIPKTSTKGSFPKLREIKISVPNFLRSGFIGTAIGILPGIGSSLATFVAYDRAKKSSKEPETFGKGNIQGVIASETSNNAVIGGALIPLLALGIPGDSVTALLLGGLQMHGLQPGPLLFLNQPDFVMGLFASFLLSVVIMYLFMVTIGARIFPIILSVKKVYLLPMVVAMSIAGTFTIGNRVEDVWIMAIFGIIGYFMDKYNFSTLPLVITLLLGFPFEQYIRNGLIQSEGSLLPFFTRPIAGGFFLLTIITLFFILKSKRKAKRSVG